MNHTTSSPSHGYVATPRYPHFTSSTFSTGDSFLAINKYPSFHLVKELFPLSWKIKSISIKISSYEDIHFIVKRTVDELTTNIFEDLHQSIAELCAEVDMSSDESLVEYKFSCTQKFYCENIPTIHRLIYEEQFHKDFANVDPKQV